jgi:hypothetical protein
MMHRRQMIPTVGCVGWLLSLASVGIGQVFHPSPTASQGPVPIGTGEAYYGAFGLDAASGQSHSYSVFRKLAGTTRPNTGPNLHTLTPLPDNDTAAIWEGVDHGGSGTQAGFHDPGMYIGNAPSASSYADQLIYFSYNKNGTGIDDPDGGVGGDNLPQGTLEPDSNDRVNWEVSVGFLEDPDGFVNGRAPHSEAWDLWSGDWGSDGIQMRLFFSATDSPDIDNPNWFSFNESAGGAIGARAQSGSPQTSIGGEANRDPIPVARQRVGSGAVIDEFDGDFPAGGSDGMAVHVGVDYDDEMELSWRMELNDPGNPDLVRAREVRFSAKTGNLEYVAVFDPGDASNPVAPNLLSDPDTPYTDGFFDWQSATPVFYLGLDNGTDYGENGAWGIMGVFRPGDFNADGTVDANDRAILESNVGQIDTSYSRGDLDQDGDTDADDLAAWDALGGGGLTGDFNQNEELDSGDIDDLTVKSASQTNPADYDLNADTLVNDADVNLWIRDLFHSWVGDADLNREFNSSDLVAVLASGTYEADVAAVWTTGDFNGDGRTNSSDLVAALADGGYEAGPRPATATVPEPNTLGTLCLGLVIWLRRCWRNR